MAEFQFKSQAQIVFVIPIVIRMYFRAFYGSNAYDSINIPYSLSTDIGDKEMQILQSYSGGEMRPCIIAFGRSLLETSQISLL